MYIYIYIYLQIHIHIHIYIYIYIHIYIYVFVVRWDGGSLQTLRLILNPRPLILNLLLGSHFSPAATVRGTPGESQQEEQGPHPADWKEVAIRRVEV